MTLPELELLYAEAKKAYHELMIGKSVVIIKDQNGETVEYNRANSAQLKQYINDLASQIGSLAGNSSLSNIPKPLRPFL